MLSELPAQTVPQWHTYSTNPRSLQQSSDAMAEDTPSTQAEPGIKDSTMGRWTHLLVVPIPCLQALTDFPQRLLKELIEPCLLNETARADVPVMDFKRNSMSRHQMVNYSMSYEIDGISMLVKAAAVSGTHAVSTSSN